MPSTWDRGSRRSSEADAHGPPAPPAPNPRSTPTPAWDRGLDPYFRWARHTHWRGFKVHAGWARCDASEACIQIIARARNPRMLDAAIHSGWLHVSEVYRRPPPGAKRRAMHFTARLKREDEHRLLANDLGLRWELALPLRDAERAALGSAHGLAGPTRSDLDFRATNLVADDIRAAQPLDHPPAFNGAVAVIDFGCPFLNEQFVADQSTRPRVAALWDQGSEVNPLPKDPAPCAEDQNKYARAQSGWPWLVPQNFNYGRELGPKALHALLTASRCTTRMLDERDIYRGIDYLIDYDDPRRRIWHATHGAHVLDVAAGRVDPLLPQADRGHDPAAKANLVFVQLPSLTAGDSSGGALSANVLDGVRYALDVCAADTPLAINISYGTFAGPHDGSSMVERALDELLNMQRLNFAIVLAAGNARLARCHAARTVRHERSVLLRCSLAAGDTTDTFVEVWYRRPQADVQIQARVRSPNRQWSAWIDADDEEILSDDARQGSVVAMLRHDPCVPNGDSSLILLAVGPTAAPADVAGALADAGPWEIEIRMVGPEAAEAGAVEVNAWIERDDPGSAAPDANAFFIDQLAEDDSNTLSSLATGSRTLVAGGINLDTGRPAAYSSRGPQRKGLQQRMIQAACEEDELQPTIAAAAIRSGEVFRMNGTSVAAPVLARRVFNRMSDGPPVAQRDWPAELEKLLQLQGPGPAVLKATEPD